MKKLLIGAAALAVLAYFGLLPFHASDVARLLPVETVIISKSGETYRVDIGEGVIGLGKTIHAALDELREQVSGEVFFQTAEQVVITEEAEDAVPEIVTEDRFRPSAGIYLTPERDLDAHEVSQYLQTRRTPLTIGRAGATLESGSSPQLPRLLRAGGGYRILA